jgi:hypothetical protein
LSHSRQIALGGIFSALCMILMFMTGMVPFSSYAFPAIAGAMLTVVVTESGTKFALLAYASISVLSILVVPDRDATLTFVAFFGYYPIVKEKLEQLPARWLEISAKLALFNTAVFGGYAAAIRLFGMAELMEGMGELAQYSLLVFVVVFNITFLVYDLALTRYIMIYLRYLRKKLLR